MLKKKIIFTIFFVIIILTSCTTTGVETYYQSEVENVTIPKLGESNTVYVGDTIFTQAIYNRKPTIELLVDYGTRAPKGTYILLGESEYGDLVYRSNDFLGSYSIFPQLLEDKNGKVCVDVTDYNFIDEQDYKRSFSYSDDSFEQQIIYTGCENNLVYFSYREFSSNYARDAYTIDLVYDLDKGNIINVKNSSFEIIEANNEKITYKVLSTF